jgi:large subunit ribosomal protein L20
MKVKRGVTKQRRHKKILELAKGYRMSYSKNYRRAKEAVLHAGQYSYNHRKHRRSQFREEWIKVISAYLLQNEFTSYSNFINQAKTKGIIIDRKILATIIVEEPDFAKHVFKEILKA